MSRHLCCLGLLSVKWSSEQGTKRASHRQEGELRVRAHVTVIVSDEFGNFGRYAAAVTSKQNRFQSA